MLLTVLAAVALDVGQALMPETFVKPPMHRVWTAKFDDFVRVVEHDSTRLWYSGGSLVGAINLKSSQKVWERTGRFMVDFVGQNQTSLYVISLEREHSTITEFQKSTGDSRVIATLPGSVFSVCADDARVYAFANGNVVAVDLKSGKTVWSRPFGKPNDTPDMVQLWSWKGKLFVSAITTNFERLDPETGRTIWQLKSREIGDMQPTFFEGGMIVGPNEPRRVDPETGREIWRSDEEFFQFSKPVGDVIVGWSLGKYQGLRLADGKARWSISYPTDFILPSDYENVPEAKKEVILNDFGWMAVGHDGKIKARYKPEAIGVPVFAQGGRMVFASGMYLAAFEGGAAVEPRTPESKRALAEQLASMFDSLSSVERDRLAKLGSYAVGPLLRLYGEYPQGTQRREELDELGHTLERVCTSEDADAMLATLAQTGANRVEARPLIRALVRRGDKSKTRAALVKVALASYEEFLKEGTVNRSAVMQLIAAVSRWDDPGAVALTMRVFQDNARAELTELARCGLAATGSAEGLRLLREKAPIRAPLRRWEDLFELEDVNEDDVIGETTDASGIKWRLRSSDVLGDSNDVYLEENLDGKWGRPVFTGIQAPVTGKKVGSFRGMPVDKFLKDGWKSALPGDEAIRKDTDGDGLTDLVEARLGTDPKKADTDGDGLLDSVDSCPMVAPGKLDDRQKIIKAALEFLAGKVDWARVVVVESPGSEPVEVYGFSNRLVWKGRGRGLASLRGSTSYEVLVAGLQKNAPPAYESVAHAPVQVSADGRHASVFVGTFPYRKGYEKSWECSLSKWGNDWFVSSWRDPSDYPINQIVPVWPGGDGFLN